MPLYDFHCPSCAGDFEMLVRFSDSPACPKCGGALERRVSLTAPQGKMEGIRRAARAQAAREGHLSNY